jgi:pimeloyl-ACP methyl ester carboxylesterase
LPNGGARFKLLQHAWNRRRKLESGRASDEMTISSRARQAAIFMSLLGGGLSAVVYFKYRRDLRRAQARVSAGSQIVRTPCGPIEYAAAGDGPSVLVVHGAGGGFDQSLEIAEPLVRSGFRVIAMSRFGYLRTPLPVDASPVAQADAHAGLLDALDIQRVMIVGASAGAPSAMQFALRYPERTAALVLLVPLAYPCQVERRPDGAMPARTTAATKRLFDAALKSDFLFWMAPRAARKTMLRAVLGTPPSVLRNASAEGRLRIAQVLDHIQPLSMRRLGLLNDAAIARELPRYELERITAPTLVLATADCLFGTYPGARYSAEHVPRARFIGYPSGGHLWVGHEREVMSEIVSFLKSAA